MPNPQGLGLRNWGFKYYKILILNPKTALLVFGFFIYKKPSHQIFISLCNLK